MSFSILHGDCLDVIKTMPDNSIDSVVTDPPYGWSFCWKKWDYDVPSVEIWKEVLRVLKPGGHALVACGTRTQHRMAVNLEDAGFEIRDVVVWAYASGFPKSMDISKAFDKKEGATREIVGRSKYEGRRPNSFGGNNNGDICYGDYKAQPEMFITKASSENAKKWEGWGTALKPAVELFTLCRKPLEKKTVAENVLAWGCGGINVDGCRIELNGDYKCKANGRPSLTGLGDRYNPFEANKHIEQGRFPANLTHDGSDEVLACFPVNDKAPSPRPGGFMGEDASKGMIDFKRGSKATLPVVRGDAGSASRFFFCAKASRSERNAGLEEGTRNIHTTVKPVRLMRYLCRLITPKNGVVLDPFCGSGSTGVAALKEGFQFVGVEREKEYLDIANARIQYEKNLNKQMCFESMAA